MIYRYDEDSGNYVWVGTPHEMAEFYREIIREQAKELSPMPPTELTVQTNGDFDLPSDEDVEQYIKTKSPSNYEHNLADVTNHFLKRVFRSSSDKRDEVRTYEKMYRRIRRAQEMIEAKEDGTWKQRSVIVRLADGTSIPQKAYYFEKDATANK